MKQDALLLIENSRKSVKELCKANYRETVPDKLTARLNSVLHNNGLHLRDKVLFILPLLSTNEQKDRILEPLRERCADAVLAALDDWKENFETVIEAEATNCDYALRRQAKADNRNIDKWYWDRFVRIIDYWHWPVDRHYAVVMLMCKFKSQIREAVSMCLLQNLSGCSLAEMFARYVYPDLIKNVLAEYASIEGRIDERFNEVVASVHELYDNDRYANA